MRKFKILFIPFFSILFIPFSYGGDSELLKKLKDIKDIEITRVDSCSKFSEAYVIFLKQALDHKNPNGKTFRQRIFLSHTSIEKPVVFITEGYAAKYAEAANYVNELSPILDANQIVVEHRYFGKSFPDSIIWEYLNIEQASADLHKIHEIFSKIYTGKWVSTGISKGGQAALSYRYFYPDDVNATVAYVSPINIEVEDSRIDTFLNKISSADCRKKIFQFQSVLLRRRELIIDAMKQSLEVSKLKYSIDPELMYDYLILEFPFSFWQWGGNCPSIPNPDKLNSGWLNYLAKFVSAFSFSDIRLKERESSYYQYYSELGYYKYNTEPFKQYLKKNSYSNRFFAPKGIDIKYNPEPMRKVNSYLQNQGNKIIYLYGEFDPWTACAVELKENVQALKIIKKNAYHSVRIESLSTEEKEQVFVNLEQWLDLKIKR